MFQEIVALPNSSQWINTEFEALVLLTSDIFQAYKDTKTLKVNTMETKYIYRDLSHRKPDVDNKFFYLIQILIGVDDSTIVATIRNPTAIKSLDRLRHEKVKVIIRNFQKNDNAIITSNQTLVETSQMVMLRTSLIIYYDIIIL